MLRFALLMQAIAIPLSAAVAVAPAPDGVRRSDVTARIRPVGSGAWSDLPVLWATSMSLAPHARGGGEGFSLFAHDVPVEIELTFPHPVSEAVVRPRLRAAPVASVEGAVVRLIISGPRYLVVEVNQAAGKDRPASTVYLLGDPPEVDVPAADAADVVAVHPGRHEVAALAPTTTRRTVLLLPGLHEVEGGLLRLQAHSRLHLAAGAVLRSRLAAEQADGLRLTRRGIIDGSTTLREAGNWRSLGEQAFVFLRGGEDMLIDGPTILDSPYWNLVAAGTRGLTIRNYKCITWRMNNDGIQPRSVEHLLVERCFLKCADDCIAIKTRSAVGMDSRDLIFRDLVCWNDGPGNVLEIGHSSQGDSLSGVRFERIAAVRSAGKGSVLSMCLADHCTVEDVSYADITAEGVEGGDFGFRIIQNRYSTDAGRGRIRHVRIDGCRSEQPPRGGFITGFDAEHAIEDVLLRGLSFAGTPPADLSGLGLRLEHTSGVRLEAGP